jgi:hypothetical protein
MARVLPPLPSSTSRGRRHSSSLPISMCPIDLMTGMMSVVVLGASSLLCSPSARWDHHILDLDVDFSVETDKGYALLAQHIDAVQSALRFTSIQLQQDVLGFVVPLAQQNFQRIGSFRTIRPDRARDELGIVYEARETDIVPRASGAFLAPVFRHVLPAFGLSVGGASGCRSFRAAHAHHAVHAMKIVLKGVLIQVHQAGGVDGSSHKPHAPGVVVSLNTP